jgi:hypothetical protein
MTNRPIYPLGKEIIFEMQLVLCGQKMPVVLPAPFFQFQNLFSAVVVAW